MNHYRIPIQKKSNLGKGYDEFRNIEIETRKGINSVHKDLKKLFTDNGFEVTNDD